MSISSVKLLRLRSKRRGFQIGSL